MTNEQIDDIHKRLTLKVAKYIKAIIQEYGKFIPKERLSYLGNINYDEIIQIYDYGNINGLANPKHILLPLNAEKALEKIKTLPGYGSNPNHQTYNQATAIINDNTFETYVNHAIVTGMTLEQYFEDLLLHETMHFCGSDGGNALKEGINEYLTRKLALKKGFHTNGCAYPKEVKIAHTLESILGEEVITQIAFIKPYDKVLSYLETTLGKDASELYQNVTHAMDEEFYNRYYRHMNHFDGLEGIQEKVTNYKQIDYSKVEQIIEQYQKTESSQNKNSSAKVKLTSQH